MTISRLPTPLERATETFSGRTVAVLREMVVKGQLRAGERLNEVELANALGISRGPLREAIQRLHSEGLLTTVPNRGAYVRVITREQLAELYEVRIALETHGLRLAAKTASAADLERIDTMLETSGKTVKSSKAYPHDQDIHRALVGLAKNQALTEAITDVHRQIDLARSRSGHQPERAKVALGEHRVIVELLAARRGEQAAKALDKHLRSSLANALALIDEQQD